MLKDMKPGNKQDALARLWNKVVVLVIEEVRGPGEDQSWAGRGSRVPVPGPRPPPKGPGPRRRGTDCLYIRRAGPSLSTSPR